jgi:phosphohistidine phosphatase SixA
MLINTAVALALVLQHLHSSSPADSLIPADSALKLMRQGGYTMIWRHAESDWSKQDVLGSPERAQQRNLTTRGETDAKAIGAAFKKLGIPVGEVRTSQLYRTRETGELAFGRVAVDTLLRQLEASQAQKQLLAAKPAKGTNRVLVTHHFVIERNVAGIRPGQVREGEAAVVRPAGDGVQLVSVIKIEDWARATGGAVVAERTYMPGATSVTTSLLVPTDRSKMGKLHQPEYENAIRYFVAFNQGEYDMRQFLELKAVPNPQRTIDQRLETYRQLKTQFGGLAMPIGMDIRGDTIVMGMPTTKGDTIVLSLRLESAEPYRLISASFARAQR